MSQDDNFAVYQMSVEDIERTKKRQYEIANYSALISGALITLVKLFSDDSIDQYPFYNVVVIACVLNAACAFWFQVLLGAALHRFRARISRLRSDATAPPASPIAKFLRDFPIFLFLLLMPVAAAGFAAWYAIRMSGISLDRWMPF